MKQAATNSTLPSYCTVDTESNIHTLLYNLKRASTHL